ncbi:MAG: glycosyltransferase family 4 protein [Pseudomonas sp.]
MVPVSGESVVFTHSFDSLSNASAVSTHSALFRRGGFSRESGVWVIGVGTGELLLSERGRGTLCVPAQHARVSRLLFDVTRLLESGLHTGIQRVVRCLLAASRRQFKLQGYDVLPVVFEGDQWRAFEDLAPHASQGMGTHQQGQGQMIKPGDGDVILLFDASWYANPWPAVDTALARGARLVGMVHDLLPVEHPEWFRQGLQPRFGDHLRKLAERAEQLFVPTVAVRTRLMARLAPLGNVREVSVLAHGGDFCSLMPTAEQIASYKDYLPAPATQHDPLYLVLGTLEPRKNHDLVLDAFEALWAQGKQPRLLFVGSVGWQVDPLLERLHNHTLLNKRLFHAANLTDPTLLWLIRNCTSLVYVPMDEGFGLPVLEASMQGCPVIAASIPVLREAGRQWPHYIKPGCLPDLIQAIDTSSSRAKAQAFHRTWDEVALQLGSFLNMVSRAQ